MAPVFAIAAALGASVAAQPISPEKWATTADYPDVALRQNKQGSVRVALMIDPTGKPLKCGIALSGGSRDLDDISCALVMKRARFVPARGRDGAAAFSMMNYTINWVIPGYSHPKPDWRVIPDILVAVARLPEAKKLIELSLRFDVDVAANVEACAIEVTSGNAAFDKAACRAVRPLIVFKTALSEIGVPAPSIQVFSVAFGVPNTAR